MRLSILLLTVQISCMTVLNLSGIVYDPDGVTLFFIAIITLALIWESHAAIRDNNLYIIFLIGAVIRIGLLITDNFAARLPIFNGGDSDSFFALAAFDKSGAFARGIYFRWLAVFFSLVGPARLFAQFVNLLAGLFSCLIILKTMRVLNLSGKAQKVCFLFVCMLPNWIGYSVVLLRESLISLFVSLSLYLFAVWYQRRKTPYIIAAILALAPSVDLHSGMVGMAAALIGGLILYDVHNRRIRMNAASIVIYIGVLISVLFFVRTLTANYLGNLDLERITAVSTYAAGDPDAGSVYLKNLAARSWEDVLLHTPIRTLYFFFSPLPTDFRGLQDIAAFLLSSVPLLAIFSYSLPTLFTCRKNRLLLFFLLLTLVFCGIIYAWGTYTAGTAMRHRDKFVPLYLLVLAVAVDARVNKRLYDTLPAEAVMILERASNN